MKVFLIITALFTALGCATQKPAIQVQRETKATLGELPESTDAVKINKASISGNIMTLEVTYTGGCKEHRFELIGREMISKSLPPIRSVKLVHTGNGDDCTTTITHPVKFDIRDLAYKQEAGSEIMLKVEGVEDRLLYSFE